MYGRNHAFIRPCPVNRSERDLSSESLSSFSILNLND